MGFISGKCDNCGGAAHIGECRPPSPDLSREEIKALARDGGSCTACQWNDAAESKCVLTGDCHRSAAKTPIERANTTAAEANAREKAYYLEQAENIVNFPLDADILKDTVLPITPEVQRRLTDLYPGGVGCHKSPIERALATQVGGNHYKDMPIQPFEYIHKNGIGFAEGCAIKYLSRWKLKGGVEDLRKARHFIDLLIEAEVEK